MKLEIIASTYVKLQDIVDYLSEVHGILLYEIYHNRNLFKITVMDCPDTFPFKTMKQVLANKDSGSEYTMENVLYFVDGMPIEDDVKHFHPGFAMAPMQAPTGERFTLQTRGGRERELSDWAKMRDKVQKSPKTS